LPLIKHLLSPANTIEQGRAMTRRDVTKSEQKTDATPRIPRRIREAINLLITGRAATQRAAAKQVGLSEQHLSRMLHRPQIQAFLASETRKSIASAQAPAAGTLIGLLQADSEHVRKDVAIHVLKVAGISPPEGPVISNNTLLISGYAIDLGDYASFPDGVLLEPAGAVSRCEATE
jgi:hypothetical protein